MAPPELSRNDDLIKIAFTGKNVAVLHDFAQSCGVDPHSKNLQNLIAAVLQNTILKRQRTV